MVTASYGFFASKGVGGGESLNSGMFVGVDLESLRVSLF